MENMDLPSRERHEKLVSASPKLNMLRALLPKLKARGHRVLLFSQVRKNSHALRVGRCL
jgi:chromodomain-helicase-DNA-binding protein 4